MSAIQLDHVTKSFGTQTAVHDVTLSVPEGAIYGFIGPNGSGKTTTIRMIMNILVPDSGRVSVLGHPAQSAIRDEIGYLPEERGLYKRMTVRQVLRYYGQLKGRTVGALDPVINAWLDRLQLGDWADKRVQTLSKGMSQKVQFISTVIAKPRLLILDEPFSGLDPVNADTLRDAVLALRREGTTIVLSTHDMGTAEQLCDRIFMIFRGQKVLDGSLDEIQAQHSKDIVRVRTSAGAGVLMGRPGVLSVTDVGNFQDVTLTGDPQAFLRALCQVTAVQHFELKKPSLHDIFVEIARPTAAELRRDEVVPA
ncbi:MAG: ATP-binding cassette domain-containing protein [Acidobacteriota bacterium]